MGKQLVQALNEGEWKDFATLWNQLLSKIPYHLHMKVEKYYHSLILIFAFVFGLKVQAESASATGRVDLSVEFPDKIYLIEFKLNTSAKLALNQIHEKKYYEPFLILQKPIYLVGINFDFSSKAISEIILEVLGKSFSETVYFMEQNN